MRGLGDFVLGRAGDFGDAGGSRKECLVFFA